MQGKPVSLAELIGGTPLLQLRHLVKELQPDIHVYAKAEWMNPGGSVKDRTAKGIVHEALKTGKLKTGGVLLDASSGNTGIAYAMLAAAMGFKLKLCLPANANEERQKTLRAYGAELILTDPAQSSDGAILKAQELAKENPEYYYADQYGNDANWKAHFHSTGPEIHRQTDGKITHAVAAIGTTGTCMGIGRYLRKNLPHAKLIAVQPDSPFHGLEGMKHLDSALVPGIYDHLVPHEQRIASTEKAYEYVRRMGKEEGLLIGISAGALIATSLEIAKEEHKAMRPAHIVAICSDGGSRYLSDHFWDET